MKLTTVLGIIAVLTTCLSAAPTTYDASLGTLPEQQGWTYTDGCGSNPAPTVSGGVLNENTTCGSQFWSTLNGSIDFNQQFSMEGNLKVLSSNYIPNIGDG